MVVEQGVLDGIEYAITDIYGGFGRPKLIEWVGYNGYVYFPAELHPTERSGDCSEVHGGVTLCSAHKGGFVYGFDTSHRHSPNYPTKDVEWIKDELRKLILSVRQTMVED